MKLKLFILFFVVVGFIAGCHKSDMATKKVVANWRLKKFYVNNVDKTDSLHNITPLWYYSFCECANGTEINGNHITGGWTFLEHNAKQMATSIGWSDTTYAGPFLDIDIWITWDFNYDKLCEDDELWLTTNYNGKKYESHFESFE